ncbi:asparagine synthase (glutamine-hydrolyzing) [Burkholderia glumae]|uniref:asparagine synthase (glutamine-hydrolyzing) n=1 Tax=Burkholderia glumae TaxID=337 RepID=UPI002036E30B|nr:asparagine synthase (glutamine-hydrolyzing) [Burkholderia glumae]MCM2545770.1 asparagine synthase (glutamine-hydrolyzing) [Burkholderia glumae]
MCGIAGAVSFEQPLGHPDFARAACRHMRHRGPDEYGFHDDRQGTLGICRLKVVGLDNGSQPTYNATRDVVCVFNGEIYNHRTLRAELEQAGHRVAGSSDAYVIPLLYEIHGDDFVHRLEGMFSIALHDLRDETLRLYTDRLGKKPLFHTRLPDGTVLFASELGALARHPEVDRETDPVAIDQYLSYRVIPAPHTIYRRIRKVPPASRITLARRATEEHRYWHPDFTTRVEHEADAIERVDALLRQAVEARLESEVPLGAMLSGGLDSSLVVGLATRALGQPVHTFSVGFEDPRFDESAHALAVARHCGTVHHTHRVSADDALEAIDRILLHTGEPYAFPSAIASFCMYRLARQYVTVVLTGDGSDEIFAGYNRYQRFMAAWRPGADFADVYQDILIDGVRQPLKLHLLADRFRARLTGAFPHNYLRERLAASTGESHALNRMLQMDTGFWLPDAQLVKIDRMAMAHSVEPRSPFLDHRVVEYVAGISPALKLVGGNEKALLKKVALRYLPAEVVHRRKQELAVPLEGWLASTLRSTIEATLLSPQALERGYFVPERLRAVVREFRPEHSYALWTMFMLERWHQLFTDSVSGAPLAAPAVA